MKQAILVVFVFTALILGPIFTIWSLNILFGMTIPLTWKTYFAALWLAIIISAKASSSSSS